MARRLVTTRVHVCSVPWDVCCEIGRCRQRAPSLSARGVSSKRFRGAFWEGVTPPAVTRCAIFRGPLITGSFRPSVRANEAKAISTRAMVPTWRAAGSELTRSVWLATPKKCRFRVCLKKIHSGNGAGHEPRCLK